MLDWMQVLHMDMRLANAYAIGPGAFSPNLLLHQWLKQPTPYHSIGRLLS